MNSRSSSPSNCSGQPAFVGKLILAVRKEIELPGSRWTVGLTVGSASSKAPQTDLDELLTETDIAAYSSKRLGGSNAQSIRKS